MAQEIERKFLVKDLPLDLQIQDSWFIKQTYLLIDETQEIRLRLVYGSGNVHYLLTRKSTGDMVRSEAESVISTDLAESLLAMQVTPRFLEKTRLLCRYRDAEHGGSRKFWLDIYTFPTRRSIIEVEFPDEETAKNFVPPGWFGTEVTHDSTYKARNIWRWHFFGQREGLGYNAFQVVRS